MAKIGRNERCPCGSGLKYKHCHGSPIATNRYIDQLVARTEAERIQRQRQQGLGKPIISAEVGGRRFVAVKNRLLHSKRWLTFHDFVFDYIATALGSTWGKAELRKPPEERHPILTWYGKLCEVQRVHGVQDGKIKSAPMTGAVAAYLHLAYDLYALDHNVELQDKLVARLRNAHRFGGARYEVFVAATFIRAGFDIAFENEDDRNTTHCEFVATHSRTGKRFSVEAKRREGRRLRVGSLFNDAISKHAEHDRVIFIDMNTPDEATDQSVPSFFESARRRLRTFEGQPLNGNERPPAYVFLTNTPWELALDRPTPRCTIFAEGFQIPDFKFDVISDLRTAINARERHMAMHQVMSSLNDHLEVPSTFDGQMAAYAFNPTASRILIGNKYVVRDQRGADRLAEVTSATVCSDWGQALCGVQFNNGTSAVCSLPLSADEIQAWQRHPDTFFGVVGQRNAHAKSPLAFYDFCMELFKSLSHERLLQVLSGSPDFDQLKDKGSEELLSIYAERLTNAAFQRG